MSKLNGKWINKDTDNLEHSGDNLKVKFSDSDAANSNKVWSSDKVNTISGTLQTNIDGKSAIGHTHTESDVTDLDKYTQAEVDTISGSLSSEIDSDISNHEAGSSHDSRYYTETELDGGQLDNRYYTESEVDTISGSLQSQIDAVGGTNETEYITLDGTDISNKYVTLTNTPYAATEVVMDIIGGCGQIYSVDYTVSSNQLGWNGLGLDGVLESGDKMRVSYTH